MTAAADIPPAAQPDGIPWERGRPARIRNLPTLPPPPPDPGVNHKHPLHHKPETGFTSCQAMGQGALCRPQDHSPPGGGSRQDRGEARGRAGGGAPPPRLVIYREKISVPRLGGPAPPPTASAFAFRLGFCDSPSWERGRPARILSLPTRPPPPVPGRPHPAPWNGVLRRGKHKGTFPVDRSGGDKRSCARPWGNTRGRC